MPDLYLVPDLDELPRGLFSDDHRELKHPAREWRGMAHGGGDSTSNPYVATMAYRAGWRLFTWRDEDGWRDIRERHDPDWLVHFEVGDLYARGEL